MEEPDFTPRNIAKFVVKAVIATKATDFAKNTITDYTEFERDDMVVKISSNVFGWGISAKLKPYTDKMVDKTADFIVAKREKMKKDKDQKDKPEEQ